MTSISALSYIHKTGLFGNYKNKSEDNLLKVSEIKNMLIVQIVQFKNSKVSIENIDIDGLKLKNEPLIVVNNKDTRILWNGPKNWLLVSSKKDLLNNILEVYKEADFAVTDLSHSRAIIKIEGDNLKEVLKKGCPFNFNELKKNLSINSTFNGISFSVDMTQSNPDVARLLTLRSFGESLYHSITDASLEYGYKAL
jgi:heterotetrameric sarcosine oxidase gamma subunit